MRKCNRAAERSAVLIAAVAAISARVLGQTNVPITQFTPGDYLVMRGGDATVPNSTSFSGEVNAYIDEYTQTGYYVGTLSLPAMTLPGGQADSHEGDLDISPNGQWVSFVGYDPNPDPAVPGTTGSPAGGTSHLTDGTESAVIGEINLAAGPSSLNTSTILPGSTNYPNSLTGQYVRGALTLDGNEFYVAGKYNNSALGNPTTTDTGLVYVSGTGASATDTVLEGGTDWRNVHVYNGQLYGGTGSSAVGSHGVYQIGTGLPTTPIPTNTELTDYPGGLSASDFALADVKTSDASAGTSNGYNVLYAIGDQHSSGIAKYYYTGSGWNYAGFYDSLNLTNPTGLVATVDPTNPAWVDITISGENGIQTYIDTSSDPETNISGSFSQLITPAANQVFYGMTQDPGPVNLIWGKTGNGSNWDVGVSSNWTYAGTSTTFGNADNVTFDDTSNNPKVTLNAVVQPGSVTFEASANSYTISGSGSIAGSGSLRLLPGNTSTVTLATANTYSGGTVVSGGLLKILPTSSTTASGLGTGPLTINGSGDVQIAAGVTSGSGTSTSNVNIGGLSIGGNNVLDITNNHIIVDYTTSDPMAAIYGYLKSGYNNGGWNGPGIISSDAKTKTNGLAYGIGFSDGNDKINGHSIVAGLSSGQIELKYTLLGDANLDGTVNGSDFSILAANFGQGYSNWDQGNFLFTPAVNGTDFSALAANFGEGDSGAAASVSAADIAALDAFAAANGLPQPNIIAVPEPGLMGLLAAIAGGLLMRRKRNLRNSGVMGRAVENFSTGRSRELSTGRRLDNGLV